MKEQQIKEKIKDRYGKIELAGTSSEGCATSDCCGNSSGTSSIHVKMLVTPTRILR